MAGTIYKAVQKRVFDFSNTQSPSPPQFIVVERIDISQYIDCMLAVRVHAATVTTGQVNFDLLADGYTDEDSGLAFRTAFANITSPAINASGSQFLTYGGTVRGHYATLVATVTKNAAGTLSVTASIDLVLRSPDDDFIDAQ